jgi:hypothetical protein
MLQKTIFSISLIFIFCFQLFSQVVTPSGAYNTLNDYKTKVPNYNSEFTITRRTVSDIKLWGGNDYKVKSVDNQVAKGIIRNEIWGIQQGDSLYLNALPLTGISSYSKVEVYGRYTILHVAYPVDSKYLDAYGLNGPYNAVAMFGAIGGGIAGAAVAVMRIPVIYDMETGDCKLLNTVNVSSILKQYTQLDEQYKTESKPSDEVTLIKYIVEINKLK